MDTSVRVVKRPNFTPYNSGKWGGGDLVRVGGGGG